MYLNILLDLYLLILAVVFLANVDNVHVSISDSKSLQTASRDGLRESKESPAFLLVLY